MYETEELDSVTQRRFMLNRVTLSSVSKQKGNFIRTPADDKCVLTRHFMMFKCVSYSMRGQKGT